MGVGVVGLGVGLGRRRIDKSVMLPTSLLTGPLVLTGLPLRSAWRSTAEALEVLWMCGVPFILLLSWESVHNGIGHGDVALRLKGALNM